MSKEWLTDRLRILVVDDEQEVRTGLHSALVQHGYDVRAVDDGEKALEVFHDWNPHLVITDISMPRMDGIQLCRQIRRISNVPIIVLSGTSEERVKVEALDAGADDYVVKPLSLQEWLARVRRNLSRAKDRAPASTQVETAHFRVDLDVRKVFVKGQETRMTPKEFDLLSYFVRHPNKVLAHRTILADVWGGHSEQTEYLRVYVGHLRRKLEPDPANPRYFLSEPWTGYRFDPEGCGSRASRQ